MPLETSLSTKGQIILPKEVRERHRWEPGTVFEIVERGDALLLRPLPRLPETTLDDLLGCTGYRGPTRTLEEMEEAIASEARKRR